MQNNPDIRLSYALNNRSYMFRFKWCDGFCLLDIYILQNNTPKYLVKGRAITTGSDIIARVKDEELITGSLVYANKYGEHIQPTQANFHTDFYLIYLS